MIDQLIVVHYFLHQVLRILVLWVWRDGREWTDRWSIGFCDHGRYDGWHAGRERGALEAGLGLLVQTHKLDGAPSYSFFLLVRGMGVAALEPCLVVAIGVTVHVGVSTTRVK